MSNNKESISVLFVCLGNICRSPMAEAVFTHMASSLGSEHPTIKADSAGTGAYHVGSPPDPRTISTLESHGITKFRHAARQVNLKDFEKFDYVFAMDDENLADLQDLADDAKDPTSAKKKISLFGQWDDKKHSGLRSAIDDPYYGRGNKGFETAFTQCVQFSRGWLKKVIGTDAVVDSTGHVTIKPIES